MICEWLETATAQEVFNKAVEGLAAQKFEQSVYKPDIDDDFYDECRYRQAGLKCGAGHLIPDNEYSKSLEGYAWRDLVEKKIVPKHHENFIMDLQGAHDQGHTPEAMKQNLRTKAEAYNLTLPDVLK